MNIRNAWGFLSFGFVMIALPRLMPDWFPPTGFDGTSARALWLEFMGGLQALLGAARMLWQIFVPAVVRRLSLVPPPKPLKPASLAAFETAAASLGTEFSSAEDRALPEAA